ncbi:hypothetical protein L6304_01160 [bacterium]|nr:hypothetical protein [bacterium]
MTRRSSSKRKSSSRGREAKIENRTRRQKTYVWDGGRFVWVKKKEEEWEAPKKNKRRTMKIEY